MSDGLYQYNGCSSPISGHQQFSCCVYSCIPQSTCRLGTSFRDWLRLWIRSSYSGEVEQVRWSSGNSQGVVCSRAVPGMWGSSWGRVVESLSTASVLESTLILSATLKACTFPCSGNPVADLHPHQ
jgi:hypothetical protein